MLYDISFEDLFWFIGWLEGEGSFGIGKKHRSPFITGESTDEDTIDRICRLLRCNKYSVKNHNPDKWKDRFKFNVRRAELGCFLLSIQKFFSSRRQKQIDAALSKLIAPIIDLDLDITLFQTYFIFWLAGYLEGEGSFCTGSPSAPNMCKIQLQTTDLDIAKLVGCFLQVKALPINVKNGTKQTYAVTKRGFEARNIMIELQPLMSLRRMNQIQRAIESHTVTKRIIHNAKFSKTDIVAIKNMRFNGATFKEIAAYFHVNKSTIGRICRGERYISENVVRPKDN